MNEQNHLLVDRLLEAYPTREKLQSALNTIGIYDEVKSTGSMFDAYRLLVDELSTNAERMARLEAILPKRKPPIAPEPERTELQIATDALTAYVASLPGVDPKRAETLISDLKEAAYAAGRFSIGREAEESTRWQQREGQRLRSKDYAEARGIEPMAFGN